MSAHTWLIDLSERDCLRLLEETPVGRLGMIVEGRPEIYPVNHVFDRESGCISFPTGTGSTFRTALEWPWVSFEVDGAEGGPEGSWSVLVIGQAEEIVDPELIERLAAQRGIRIRWITGSSVRWIRIRPRRITGRRISATAE